MTSVPHLHRLFLRGAYLFRQWVALCLLFFTASTSQAQTTYGEIPLDCGGWVSGFAQHPSGRLYGYGDIFGVYRSDDFGANWRFLQGSITEFVTFVQAVAVSPVDVNRVTFSTSGTLWTSTDGGETWTKRLADLNAPRKRGSSAIAYHPTQPDELWMAGPRKNLTGSLWRSVDHGLSWTPVGGTPFVDERALTIHIFPSAPNEIWVGTAPITGVSTAGGLWCSADSGATWRKVWDNGGAVTTYYGQPHLNSIARNAARVSVFATNTGVFQVTATNWNDPTTYVATQRTFSSQSIPNVTTLADGTFWCSEIGDQTWAPKVSSNGSTWTDRQISMSAAYVPEWNSATNIISKNRVYGRDMLVQDVNNPARWLVTGGASAHLSEDNGLTWRYQPGGMSGMATYRVNFDTTNPGRAYLSTSDHGIFVLTDGGLSGKTAYCSNRTFHELQTFHETMVSANGQTIVGAGVHQGLNRTVIIRSTDSGASWTKLTPLGLPDNYEGVTRAVMSPNDPNDFLVLLGYTDRIGDPNSPGLYRTTDGGANFTKVGGTSFDGIDTGMRYHAEHAYLERDGVNPTTRYLALRAPNNSAVRGVWRSLDGGTTWTQRVDPVNGQWTLAFAVDPTIEGRLWAANSSLRRSDDGGGSWVTIGNFTAVKSINAHGGRLAVLGKRTGDTFNKIYASSDNGMTWKEMTNPQNRMPWAQTVTVDPYRTEQIWVGGSRSFQVINPPLGLDPLLAGSVSGSAPFSSNPAYAAAKAFDGDTATFFAPEANGGFALLDLGAGKSARITTVRFFPRAGFESRMNGGRFEGSADGTSWTTLVSLTVAPTAEWQTRSITDTGFYRYLRYIHPTGLADVAEIEFRGQAATPPVIENLPLPTLSGLVGQLVSYTIRASGIPAPTFAITSGSLPAGLTLNATSGIISGAPSASASGSITIQASNVDGSTTAPLTLNIPFGPRLAATTPSPSHIQTVNTTRTAFVTLTNTGDAPLSWSASVPTVSGNYALADNTTPGNGLAYDWIDAVNGGTKVTFGSVDDSNASPITLPFSFPFYGTQFNSVRICTNGWLSFTSTATTFNAPSSLPSSTTPENLLAPFMTDLYLRADSSVYYRTIDPQTFVISFIDVVIYTKRNDPNPARFSFQAVLRADGRILFQYQKISDLTQTRIVGIQNAGRTLGTTVALPSPVGGLVGRVYQFTPPVGWLTNLSPPNSSSAGSSLPAGTSTSVTATINTTGLTAGQNYTANITFTSNDSNNPTRLVPFALTVYAPSSALANFRFSNGLAADGSQDLQIPAEDGVTNLLKYAFNMIGNGAGQATNLSTPNSSILTPNGNAGLPLVGTDGSGKLTLTYIRRKAATNPGISYSVEFTNDLGLTDLWAVNPAATEGTPVSIDSQFERVTVTDSISPSRRFARVRVSAP